jgi:type I restriction enzyme S subunit
MSEEQYQQFVDKGLVPNEGDILVTSRGTLGLCYIVRSADKFYFQDGMISWLENKKNEVNSIYIKQCFSSDAISSQIEQNSSGTTVNYLSLDSLGNLKVMTPPLPLQNRFAAFVRQADKSKFELQRTLDDLEATCKCLLREHLG